MKKTLLIALSLIVSFGLKAQTKSIDVPDLEKINIKELDVKTEDITFDEKNTNNQEQVFTSVDIEPHFQGGINNFYDYIQRNMVYPKKALKQRVEGKVFIGFIVEKDGSITNIKIIRGLSLEIDAQAGRVISNSPNWSPGILNEKPVRFNYVVPIIFKLPPDSVIKQQLLIDSLGYNPNQKVFSAVEKEPTFPGGLDKFYQFLQSNIKYPDVAKRNDVQGRVFLTFVVERNGSLTNVKVVRGIGSGCDEEAKRVIEISPKWNPGIQNKKPVRVQYTMPISFTLTKR